MIRLGGDPKEKNTLHHHPFSPQVRISCLVEKSLSFFLPLIGADDMDEHVLHWY
jgi:hypothetical protein